MPCYPQSLSTHLPVFPGCQSLSRHLSDGVKRPVPLCHRHLSAGNPCAIVALLALESSSKKGVAGGRGLEPLLISKQQPIFPISLFISCRHPYRLLHRHTSFLLNRYILPDNRQRFVVRVRLHHRPHHFVGFAFGLFPLPSTLHRRPSARNGRNNRCSSLRHQGEHIAVRTS